MDATGLQIPGVLDDLYSAKAGPVTLGPSFKNGQATLRVWAPTARDIKVRVFADSSTATFTSLPMTLDPASGIWSYSGGSLYGKYYQYETQVFVRSTNKVETNVVTDPYSVSAARALERAMESIKTRGHRRAADLFPGPEPAARGPAAGPAHRVRPGDDAGGRLLPRNRELLAAPDRAQPGRPAAHADGLLPRRRAPGRGREPRDDAPAARDVLRGSLAQGNPRRVRLPRCLRRSTTGRCASRSSRSGAGKRSTSRPRPRSTS